MSQHIVCQRCNHQISYSGVPPKFCSECGVSLSGSHGSTNSQAAETIAHQTPVVSDDDATMPPDRTGPVLPSHVDRFKLETVGPYRLIQQLGQGGMGTVFEAQHMETGRSVALKLLSAEVRGTDEMVQRFRRESQIAASINHPRSTFVYEAGDHQGQLYIAMELMSGGTLKEIVEQEGPLPVGRAVDYIIDIIDGLSAAHSVGIVHRDLKPSNSFVDADGRIKVGDFGLAKSFLGDSTLTATGTFMGTPQYAAPEQIRNADVDERTDIYAIGGMLFYLLTGRAPFVGNPAQVISSIASDTPPSVREVSSGIPRPLAKLIAQTLEKDPAKRPLNLNILRDGLLPFSSQGAITAEPGLRVAAFFIDAFVASVISMVPNILGTVLVMAGSMIWNWRIDPQSVGVFIVIPAFVCYFAICEHLWGRTVGKWMMGIRVIDRDLELPSWGAAFIRASLIPGLTSLLSTVATLYLFSRFDAKDLNDAMALISMSQAVGLVFYVPLLLLLATCRKSNGYRGIHGILSGTRVVRVSGGMQSRQLSQLAVTSPALIDKPITLGPYEAAGVFRYDGSGGGVYLGTDKKLDRSIWIFDGLTTHQLTDDRRNLLRPNRLRIIREGQENDSRWYATESVPGLPLKDAIGQANCEGHAFYTLIRDLAFEMEQSINDGSMPQGFSVDHCWLDQNGHVRLLDHVIVANPQSAPKEDLTDVSDSARGAAVISDLLDRFMKHHDYPVEIIKFRNELKSRIEDSEVLPWIVSTMNSMVEKLVSWSMVDRIGMLAITLGFEFAIVNAVFLLIGYLFLQFDMSPLIQTAMSVAGGIGLVFLLGYFFDGGLAIRMINVSVRRFKDQQAATRLQCGLRNAVAWTPWLAMLGLGLYSMFYQAVQNPNVTNVKIDGSSGLLPMFLVGLALLFFVLFTQLHAIAFPKRGIVDWIVGTVLMRK